MPIDFSPEARIRFDPDTGGFRTGTHKFEFPSNVRRATSFVNGFNIGFRTSEHPLAQVEVNTRVQEIDEEDVIVLATFSLRDNSGNFDDKYEGFVDVVVVVERA